MKDEEGCEQALKALAEKGKTIEEIFFGGLCMKIDVIHPQNGGIFEKKRKIKKKYHFLNIFIIRINR